MIPILLGSAALVGATVASMRGPLPEGGRTRTLREDERYRLSEVEGDRLIFELSQSLDVDVRSFLRADTRFLVLADMAGAEHAVIIINGEVDVIVGPGQQAPSRSTQGVAFRWLGVSYSALPTIEREPEAAPFCPAPVRERDAVLEELLAL